MLCIFRKYVLKQALKNSEELEEEIMPLSNMYGNNLDNLVDNSDK